MFNNPNIFNPSITYNNHIYFNTPSGNPYEYKTYNPNNQSVRLPYNFGQYYENGTKKYYDNLQGLNSNKFKHDNIIGKTVYTESGRPIQLTNNKNVKIPQVKYDYDIPVKLNWGYMDYCELDTKATQKSVKQFMDKHFNIPLNNDVKDQYKATNPTQMPIMTNETINDSYNNDYNLKPVDMNNENIMKIINNRNKQYDNKPIDAKNNDVTNNSINKNLETFIQQANTIFNNNLDNTKERFSDLTLCDTDELYREIIRAYAKAVSFYLNNNSKYCCWKKNWEILEKNLRKSDLKIDRLNERDNDIAYTENKGEIIKFRWRDNSNYISKNIFMYVVLHELTHQVFPMSFKGHGDPFPDMLCIICVAGFELSLFNLESIPRSMVYTNNQPICSRMSIYNELMRGIEILRAKNPGAELYYNHLTEYINHKMKQ